MMRKMSDWFVGTPLFFGWTGARWLTTLAAGVVLVVLVESTLTRIDRGQVVRELPISKRWIPPRAATRLGVSSSGDTVSIPTVNPERFEIGYEVEWENGDVTQQWRSVREVTWEEMDVPEQ